MLQKKLESEVRMRIICYNKNFYKRLRITGALKYLNVYQVIGQSKFITV
jgi:hypothetical protein